jgi:hypothetical protein
MTSENVQGQVKGESAKKATFVDALFDIGLAWAEFGVGQSKKAIETSAKTLEKVAHSLDDLQQRLRKDAQA